MEIPSVFSDNRRNGMGFYDELIDKLEKVKMAAIKDVITVLDHQKVENFITYIDQYFESLKRDVKEVKQQYYDDISMRFNHIQKFDETNMDEDEETVLKSTYNAVKKYNSIQNNDNLNLMGKMSQSIIEISDMIPELEDVCYEGINRVLDSSFACVIDKNKAKAIDGHRITQFPIYDKNRNEIVSTAYEPIGGLK